MANYVEQHDGGDWVSGTRVSLDSLVYAFWRGQSPESIAGSFPTLTLQQVYGAIAYYLENRIAIDESLKLEAGAFEQGRAAEAVSHPAMRRRLEEARKNLVQPR